MEAAQIHRQQPRIQIQSRLCRCQRRGGGCEAARIPRQPNCGRYWTAFLRPAAKQQSPPLMQRILAIACRIIFCFFGMTLLHSSVYGWAWQAGGGVEIAGVGGSV